MQWARVQLILCNKRLLRKTKPKQIRKKNRSNHQLGKLNLKGMVSHSSALISFSFTVSGTTEYAEMHSKKESVEKNATKFQIIQVPCTRRSAQTTV